MSNDQLKEWYPSSESLERPGQDWKRRLGGDLSGHGRNQNL